MEQEPIRIDTGRRKFEISRNGETKLWEYDILELKLLFEELEAKHGLRNEKNEVLNPTGAFLHELASRLQVLHLDYCTLDVAFRIYNVVNTQFRVLYASISVQVSSQANPPKRNWWEKLLGRR